MRLISIFVAALVACSLYFLIVDRKSLIDFLKRINSDESEDIISISEDKVPTNIISNSELPFVIVKTSLATETENILILRGRTQAIRKVEVRAEVNGGVISEPRLKGSRIKKNETLCEIAAGTRYVTLNEAKIRLLEAEKKSNVVQSLGEKGYSTETNKLTQKTILEAAKASLARAEYEITKLKINAPFAGILENDTAEIGSYLNMGSLCGTIIDLSKIKLIGYIPELKVRKISLGSDAFGTTVSGISTSGKVSFISKQADQVTKTFRVEIIADNYNELIRDGETVEIRILLESNSAHLLPQSVLTLNDRGELGVRTVIDNKVEFFKINILRDQESGLLVTGLPEKVDVITVGQEFVLNGQNVNVSYEWINEKYNRLGWP